MSVILKTIVTSSDELLYVLAQILELNDLVDRFVITEPAFTHTGLERKLVGIDRLVNCIPELIHKVEYFPLPHIGCVKSAFGSEPLSHANETITRGMFVDFIDISPTDIVISTDADEVLYSDFVSKIIDSKSFKINPIGAYTLTLNQFFYTDKLLATGHKFVGPSIIRAARLMYLPGYKNWRYAGHVIGDRYAGCHYSWCQPLDKLVDKVRNFAHGPNYYTSDIDVRERIVNDINGGLYSFRTPNLKLTEMPDEVTIHPTGYLRAKSIWGGL